MNKEFLHKIMYEKPIYEDSWGNKRWDHNCEEGKYSFIITANETQLWNLNHKLHNINGPAIISTNGAKTWYYHGKQIGCSSQQKFEKLIKLKAFW